MGQRIDQLCETLRIKLTNVDSGLKDIKAKIDKKAEHAEQDVRSHLDGLRGRIKQDQKKVSAARAKVEDWVESRKVDTDAKIAEWKAKRETSKLQKRADKAEEYAAAAIVVSLAAVDEAEEAALEAYLARQDADAAQAK
jgi:hypothetical protein